MIDPRRVSRFVDKPGDSVPLGTYIPPWTVPELLQRMELTEASREHQQAAIDAWLSCHEPLPILREGLEIHGFLPAPGAVEEPAEAAQP